MKKLALSFFILGAVFSPFASAALVSADVNSSSILTDMAIVFIIILGVLIISFGYKMITRLLTSDDGSGEFYIDGKKFKY
ncbi:MAG: hypothetical protein V2A75_00905 [Pseudomonadota bacterium]